MEYSPEDEKLIEALFQDLLRSCEKIIKRPEDWDTIKRAFLLAKEAHKGIKRQGGGPYLTHPIAVAKIVVDEIGLGVKSVAAALLHDVVEDNENYSIEDVERMFNPKIASMVDGLTKIDNVFDNNPSANVTSYEFSSQAESFRKVLLTLSDDARVILIKIADRLHNMRTLGALKVESQIKIASETIFLFAPLAYRLGLYQIKTELENLSLQYRFPDAYKEITEKLKKTEENRALFIENFISPIRKALQESNIKFRIEGRVKTPYSIWTKMQRKQIPFEEIYDLFAIRIVFEPSPLIPEKSQCWHIYSLVTDIYNHNPERMRDWIKNPKVNGYEALHATVMAPGGMWVEVQIRSQRMDEIAEMGFASHWKYKRTDTKDDEAEFDKRLIEIREVLRSHADNAIDFLDDFKLLLYTTEIIVYTPKGESRKLPKGATALDFAYAIHTNIGHQAIAAKINHNIDTIFAELSSGDQIEIVTSKSSFPKPEWLDHVATAKARQAIKTYLKGDAANNLINGRNIFEEKLKEFGIKPSARLFRKVLPAYNVKSKDEFYSNLGSGLIKLDKLGEVIQQNAASKLLKFWTIEMSNPFRKDVGKQNVKIIKNAEGEGGENDFAIATCCNPVPGDQIIGYFNKETGATEVHKTSCDELTRLATRYGNRIHKIEWSSHKAMSHFAIIEMRGIDRIGILLDVSKLIASELNINIRELNIRSHDGIFEGTVSVYVKSREDIDSIINKTKKIKGIEMVKRIS